MSIFGRKGKTQRGLRILDAGGAALYDGPMADFQLPEAVTLRLSVELFDDPEPCHIHRSAVLSRACLELCEACDGLGAVRVSALPEGRRRYLGGYPGAATVEVVRR